MGEETVIPAGVGAFAERARALTDEERRALAGARHTGSEVVRAGAWKAALEMLPERAGAYVSAHVRIGDAFVPERLDELRSAPEPDPVEVAEWQDVARLVRIALDETLVALLLSDIIPPPAVRELLAPWRTMLEAASRS